MDVGETIRSRRKRQGLTLAVLARGSGVSRAMLSDVERGQRSPTVKILAQIATGLGCRVADLLAEPEPERIHLERAPHHAVVLDEQTGVERRTLASPLLSPGLEVVQYILPGGVTMRRGPEAVWYVSGDDHASGPFPPNPYGTVEHVALVKGRVVCRARDETFTLRVGDAVNYRIVDEVELRNVGRGDAHLSLLIDTHPSRRP